MSSAEKPEPRLQHEKRVYRLWFEFLKRAYQDNEINVDEEFYEDWGNVVDVNFNDWWEDHKVDLFGERKGKPRILSDSLESMQTDDAIIYLEVPINKQIKTVLKEIEETIRPSFSSEHFGRKSAFPSTAKFQVTQGVEVRIPAFRMMLRCYHIKKSGVRSDKIPKKVRDRIKVIEGRQQVRKGKVTIEWGAFKMKDDDDKNVTKDKRNVHRYIQQARKIVRNVAKGEFPGKYT